MKRRILSFTLCLLLALTLWVPAQATSDTAYKAVLTAALDKLMENVPNPSCGTMKGEWAVLALARSGADREVWYGTYLDNLCAFVESKSGALQGPGKIYTEFSRVILGLSSIGQDASAFNTGSHTYDLVTPLLDKQTNGRYWAYEQGNVSNAFVLIALDSQNYLDNDTGKAARAEFLDILLNDQRSDGSWGIYPEDDAGDTDSTAMVLQALAPYYLSQTRYDALGASHTYTALQSAVNKALNYLKGVKSNNYGTVESAAQVVVALAALGRNAASDTLLGDALGAVLAYRLSGGGFSHTKNGDYNQISTEQAAYALVAYDRYYHNQTSLYDMTDLGKVSAITITAPAAVAAIQLSTGRIQVSSGVPCVAIVKKADGSYACLTPEGSGNTRTFHTVSGGVTVLLRGDANGDGIFDGSDVTRAKAAFLGKTSLDEIHKLAADVNRDQIFDGSDVTRAKAVFLGKTSMDW